MSDFLETSYYGNSVSQWLLALSFMALAVAVGLLFYRLFGRVVRFFTKKTKTKLDDIIVAVLAKPMTVFLIGWGIRYGLNTLTFPKTVVHWLDWGFQFFGPAILVWFLFRLYAAFHKEYAVSIAYLIMSRAIFFLAIFVAALFLVRLWIIQPTFCYPDCVGANLIGLNMSGIDLSEADFVEANLRGSDLSGADLSKANLSATDLVGVSLRGANLQNSKFLGANMRGADLREANLYNTQLNGANLSQADLTRTNLTRVQLSGAGFAQAKLVEVNLAGRDLSGVDLSRANLVGANLVGANLSGASLSGADLSGASLKNANLAGAWLNLANLTGVDLTGANLAGASLIGSNMASANLTRSNLGGATLIGANLNGANLKSADLTGFRLLQVEERATDLSLDPVLKELNKLQLSQVVKDGNLSGVQFNSQTIWPLDKRAILAQILGQDFAEVKVVEKPEVEEVARPETIDTGHVSLPPVNPAQVKGNIYIASSSTVFPLSQALVEAFAGQGYNGKIRLDDVGSGEGLRLFCQAGETDIAYASRSITAEETEACLQTNREPVEFRVGTDALVVVVNPLNNFIANATLAELKLIFSATNWSEVNPQWPSTPISRIVLNQNKGEFGFFAEQVFGADIQSFLTAPQTQLVEDNDKLVEGITLDPEAVGFLGFGASQRYAGKIKLLSIEDVEPNAQTVQTGEYILARPLNMYSDADIIRQKPQVGAFISFYLSNVNRFVEAAGYFPASPAEIDQAESLLLSIVGS